MSSLVSDFIINPVLRQARRFSEISRATLTGEDEVVHDSNNMGTSAVHEDLTLGRAIVDSPSADLRHPLEREAPDGNVTTFNSVEESLWETPSPRVERRAGGPIPEDDGMRLLRTRIHSINARAIAQADKARLIHETLTEGYRASRSVPIMRSIARDDLIGAQAQITSASPPAVDTPKFRRNAIGDDLLQTRYVLDESDIAPTYAPIRQPKYTSNKQPSTPPESEPPLGCQHYERNVKLQCSTCHKWYTCRFCHDAAENHSLIRNETEHMLCMLCATPQKASDVCINCGEIAAQYYCNICKLWENRQSKPIYHCNDCGICRRGLGLGKDFFHCKTCRACITTSIETSHKCIERSTDCDCPICGEYMFTSPKPVVFMPCGHSIHKKCYELHMRVSYKCPLCNKSLANMETQFRNLDLVIQGQPMPPEFRDTKAVILCNDCSGRCTVPYHWLGLKCSICRSYNTVELQILGGNVAANQQTDQTDVASPVDLPTTRLQHNGQSAARPMLIQGTTPRAGIFARRRHSSNGIEIQRRASQREARPFSPLSMIDQSTNLNPDMDSDNDGILGFWRSADDESESTGSNGHGSEEEDSENHSQTEEEDDDDDDANEIVLIGHR